jgi:glyoxylase-like metal-dependent hydrolase (beta-lactamase superfamily II)/ferredoxin
LAKIELQNKKNTPGPLFVDTSCIDCGTCFHIAPEVFQEQSNLSVVVKQPNGIGEWAQAKEAILSCPTNSIGVQHPPKEFKEAPLTLPRLITDDIYFCGYTSEDSYGATSYLVKTSAGNILIDSPRFNSHLVNEIENLGGVEWMFLSHRDDVAHHQKFRDHFKCQRIIHKDDIQKTTEDCEIVLQGQGDVEFNSDIKIIMTPGHTVGHMVLYYKNKYLFTGDHLFYDFDLSKVYASKSVNWYSWSEQLKSIRKLEELNVEWVFPGHGGWSQLGEGKFKSDLDRIRIE